MATATPVRLAQAALTATLTTPLYPATGNVIVKEIWLSNTSNAPVAATIRAGVGSGVAQTLVPASPIPANGMLLISCSLVLAPGDVISGGAAVAGVVGVTISGVTVV